ncbi:uncharacterized protein LOC129093163 [Anoplopoma fimbria]|uniref:uncharacterized protein LOC129093163 n=1 Tax=Anoplopoma fimbria TaxID=229290 RepID=UPI0023ECAFAD|nr:uncharacterized protein LOC129093163 [Anoplopoma fimbria]
MFKFYVLLVRLFGAYGALLYARPGQNVTLPCFHASKANNLCWYKQVAGGQPQIISSYYIHSPDTNRFHNQFKGNKRFSVHTGERFYHLNISNVQDSDSAMYYCGHTNVVITEFDNGTFLVLKGSESSHRSFLQQPASDSVKPGDSVTLNCTVHTGTSDTEHSVYWFKKENSSNSHLGIMYINTHSSSSSSQCVRSLEPPAQSCVYSLSKRNVSLSDAGTYYCAVASCGEILFGNGTRLEVGGQQGDIYPLWMQCLVAVLLVSVILNIILIGVLCKMSRRKYLHSQGRIDSYLLEEKSVCFNGDASLQPRLSVPEDTSDSQNEESDAMQYVALDFKKRQSKSRRQRSPEKETIYNGVRLSDLK